MTMPIAELPVEIVELMPDGPYLSANERYLRFIIYSLAEQNIQEQIIYKWYSLMWGESLGRVWVYFG